MIVSASLRRGSPAPSVVSTRDHPPARRSSTPVGGAEFERAAVLGHRLEHGVNPPASPGAAPIQRARDKGFGGKGKLGSAKAKRRAEASRAKFQAKHERRKLETPIAPIVTGGVPTGTLGVLMTLMMLSAHIHGAHAQPQIGGPGPQPRRALPNPRVQPPLLAAPASTNHTSHTGALLAMPHSVSSTNHTALSSQASIPHVFHGGHVNATAPHLHVGQPGVSGRNVTTAPRSAPRRTKPPPSVTPETTIGKSGKLVFGNDEQRQKHAKQPNAMESLALNKLLRTTATGGGVLSELDELGYRSTIIRTNLGRNSGEATPNADMVKVHSGHDLRANAITAAHEFRHREQFGHGILEKNSNPYRMAAAEIEAKTVGAKTYKELDDAGYFGDNSPALDGPRLDSEDYRRDPQAFKRTTFKAYLSRYRGEDVARYPDFASNHDLDTHIAAQEQYFDARRKLSRIEAQIKQRGLSPNDPNLPAQEKSELMAARFENREKRRAVSKTEPKTKTKSKTK